MFGWLRNLAAKVAGRPGPDARLTQMQDRYASLKAKYDAAQTNDDNRRHWANADHLSAAAANALPVRQFLRSRSRYEYDNGSYCSGIIRTRADDLVGTGPTLQILTDDDALNEQIETAFSSWCRACRFAEKLHTMDQARSRDGEAFAVLVTNPKLKNPVKLDLELVECDRVTDPNLSIVPPLVTPTGQPMRLDGIEYDASGNPIAYHILDHHPGDFLGAFPMQARRVSAEYVLHWFRKDRPGQLRGVPELTAALPLFPYLRRWTLATLAAAETAASFAVTLESPDGATAGDVPPRTAAPFSTIEIERNMYTELPAGVQAKQIAAEHPNQQYETFKREILAECGRPVRMPVNVVAADSSKHNFSSGKLDHYGYRGGLRVDRHYTEINHLDHVFEEFVAEASLIPGLLPAGVDVLSLKRAWYWPGWASMDKDDAKNDTERLNNGTATLQEILAEWNIDWKESIRQRGRELKYMAEQGVPPPAPAGGGGLGGGSSSSGTSGSDGGGAVGGSGVIDVAALRGAILNGNGRAH